MLYTILFGITPLLIRIIISSASPPESPVAWFSLSDFAFFGIMLNAATISGITSNKIAKPNVIFVFTTISVMLIMFFVTIHTVAMFSSFNLCFPTAWGVVLILISFYISASSTDPDSLRWVQNAFDQADWYDALTGRHEREYSREFIIQGCDNPEQDFDPDGEKLKKAVEMDELQDEISEKYKL